MNDDELKKKVAFLIKSLRKKENIGRNWEEFKEIIKTNLDQVCAVLDTRWLISICDTFVDYGSDIEKRNAMLVVQFANLEKLWATYLLMYDINLNSEKLNQLKKNKIIPLWDGMYSFNIHHGDMTNNMFSRMDLLMKETPVIEKFYQVVLERHKLNDTVLSNLNKYHKKLFEPNSKRSLIRIIRRKIRQFFKSYKL